MKVVRQDGDAVCYSDARAHIADGDLLLFRPRGWWGWLISVGTLNPWRWIEIFYCGLHPQHSHVARAIWWGKSLWAVQQISNPYKHLERMSELAQRFPGCIDVYGRNFPWRCNFHAAKACEAHKSLCFRRYGWFNVLRLLPRHLPLIRRLMATDTDDQRTSWWPPFCSMAFSMSERVGGVDPCPSRADRDTEPHHLAESPVYYKKFTLG